MAKKQGGGKLLPLPFTTFGEIAALNLKATVYCSRCFQHRPIDPAAEHLRDRCFATTRFRCCEVGYTGDVCGCLGSVAIKPSLLLPVGGKDTLAFLFCVTCEPSWWRRPDGDGQGKEGIEEMIPTRLREALPTVKEQGNREGRNGSRRLVIAPGRSHPATLDHDMGARLDGVGITCLRRACGR